MSITEQPPPKYSFVKPDEKSSVDATGSTARSATRPFVVTYLHRSLKGVNKRGLCRFGRTLETRHEVLSFGADTTWKEYDAALAARIKRIFHIDIAWPNAYGLYVEVGEGKRLTVQEGSWTGARDMMLRMPEGGKLKIELSFAAVPGGYREEKKRQNEKKCVVM